MHFKRKEPYFLKTATQQGAISLFIFYSANLSNLWIVNNFSPNILFFFSPIASLLIHDLLKWNESRDLMNRNNRVAIIIANVTHKLMNQFLKQNGWVRSMMLQLKKGSHSVYENLFDDNKTTNNEAQHLPHLKSSSYCLG